MSVNPWDVQEGGSHYKKFKVQPAYFCYINDLTWMQGNVIKYVCRDKDNKIQDLKKARHYLDLLIYEEEIKENARVQSGNDKLHTSGDVSSCGKDVCGLTNKLLDGGLVYGRKLGTIRAGRVPKVDDPFYKTLTQMHKEASRAGSVLDSSARRVDSEGQCSTCGDSIRDLGDCYWCKSCDAYFSLLDGEEITQMHLRGL